MQLWRAGADTTSAPPPMRRARGPRPGEWAVRGSDGQVLCVRPCDGDVPLLLAMYWGRWWCLYRLVSGWWLAAECDARGYVVGVAEVVDPATIEHHNTQEFMSMASKYLKGKAASRVVAAGAVSADDPVLFRDRPALREFMTLTSDDAGSPRELSVLMVCAGADGFRVGLKDDGAGGWCWRVGETVAKALNAIEKALVGDEPSFRQAGGFRGKQRR